MEKEDIDSMPIFSQEGVSWGKLDKVFDGELEAIIHEINASVAAWSSRNFEHSAMMAS